MANYDYAKLVTIKVPDKDGILSKHPYEAYELGTINKNDTYDRYVTETIY